MQSNEVELNEIRTKIQNNESQREEIKKQYTDLLIKKEEQEKNVKKEEEIKRSKKDELDVIKE